MPYMNRVIAPCIAVLFLVFVSLPIVNADRMMAETLFESGVIQFEKENYKKAVMLFGKAIEEDDAYAHPHFYLAKSYEKLKKKSNAESEYRECYQILNQLEKLTKEEKGFKEEVDAMFAGDTELQQKWLKLNHDPVKELCAKAKKYMNGKHHNAAEQALHMALVIDPENSLASELRRELERLGGQQIVVFDGKTLDGWEIPAERQDDPWTVAGGCLATNTAYTSMIFYTKVEVRDEYSIRGKAMFSEAMSDGYDYGVSAVLGYKGKGHDFRSASVDFSNAVLVKIK